MTLQGYLVHRGDTRHSQGTAVLNMDRKIWARWKIQMVPERWVLFFLFYFLKKNHFAAKVTTYVNWGCIHFGQ